MAAAPEAGSESENEEDNAENNQESTDKKPETAMALLRSFSWASLSSELNLCLSQCRAAMHPLRALGLRVTHCPALPTRLQDPWLETQYVSLSSVCLLCLCWGAEYQGADCMLGWGAP